MTQFEKLQDILKNPKNYGVKSNTREFKMLCKLYLYGKVQTGKSGISFKYVLTYEVFNVLKAAGISCEHYNESPQGGANGEHVALCGKVKKDVVRNYAKFVKEHSDLMRYEREEHYLALL